MKKNVRKNKPLRISSSYESYCRERKAARSRNESDTSLRCRTNCEQQPLIEIQSRDDDDDRINSKRDNKLTPVTVPSMASWSVSSKSIVNSWYEPTVSTTANETSKTIQSYASNTGVFSPVYEVTTEHANLFEQNGLPLPKPGQTPRFGSLRYKADDGHAATHKGREDNSSDSFHSVEVSSQQVREKLKQLKRKTVRLLGATTPVPSQTTQQHTELGIGASSLSEKTFESYLRGEWKLGSTSGSIEDDLSLDPIVQVRGSGETESNNSNIVLDTITGRKLVTRVSGSETIQSPGAIPGDGRTPGVFESGNEETTNCCLSCGSLQQPIDEMSISVISSSDPSVVDLTSFADNDLGSERKPLSLEHMLPDANTEFTPDGPEETLDPPELLDAIDTTKTTSNLSPDKHGDDVLTDVTSTSHNRTEEHSESDGDSSRPTYRNSHQNNQNMTYAPSAEQIYQSIVDRKMKKQRGLTPKSSKAITVSLESEALKPVVILSRQFAHSDYHQGNSAVLIPSPSNSLAGSFLTGKLEGRALPTDHLQKLERNRRGANEKEGENSKRKQQGERVALEAAGRHPDENSTTTVGDTLIDEIRGEITRMHSNKCNDEHYSQGCDESHPLRIGSHDLEIPDLNDICLRATGSDFGFTDLNDDELRAVMQITNDGDNVSVIFPTFSCDTVHECYSDDGLSRELDALSPLQKELEVSLKAASALSPTSMPLQLTSPMVYDCSTDSSMVDLQSLCKSSAESNRDGEIFRTSLPFTRRVQFRDEVQELLFTHELGFEEDPPVRRRSFFDRLFSSFDDLIDDISTACVACSGGGQYHEKSVQNPRRSEV